MNLHANPALSLKGGSVEIREWRSLEEGGLAAALPRPDGREVDLWATGSGRVRHLPRRRYARAVNRYVTSVRCFWDRCSLSVELMLASRSRTWRTVASMCSRSAASASSAALAAASSAS